MSKEEKELLLKDLCARLPYGVQVAEDNEWIGTLMSLDPFDLDYTSVYVKLKGSEKQQSYFPSEIKPYLRPMSSITEEETKEFRATKDKIPIQHDEYNNPIGYESAYTLKSFDWLNAHHFDYRNLIGKGLALEASEGMYKME